MNLFLKCAIAVASSATQSLGLTFQRMSYLGFDDVSGLSNIHIWRLGVTLFVLANLLGSTVQLALLPLVLICTLQAAGLVANSMFAWLLLHEPLTRAAAAGTCLVISGAVFVAAFGGVQQADPDLSLDELIDLLYAKSFMFYMFFTLSIVLACVYKAQKDVRLRSAIRGILYGFAGGILSAHSLLMAKIVIGLLVRDFSSVLKNLARFQFWVPLSWFLMFALGQMWCVNSGLQGVSTSVLYPLVFCVYNVTTLLNGLTFYGTSRKFMPKHVGFVLCGTCILLLGVGLLSSRLDDDALADSPDVEQGSTLNTALASPGSTTRFTSLEPAIQRAESLSETAPSQLVATTQARSPLANKRGPDSPLLDSSTTPQYTSFESLNPNISNPDKSRSRHNRRLSWQTRGRVLSKEQKDILRELYM